LKRLGRFDKDPKQPCVYVEQLFVMRHSPVGALRVPEKPAVDVVVEAAPAHRVERRFNDVSHRGIWRVAMNLQCQFQRSRKRKLRGSAEAAILAIVRGEHGRHQIARRGRRGRYREPLRHIELGAARCERSRDAIEDTGHAVHRDVGTAAYHGAVSGKKRRRRPAAKVVPLGNVGPAIRVHTHRHEPIVEAGGNLRVGVCRSIHVVAGFAPDCRD
jgi:hypothetical protein